MIIFLGSFIMSRPCGGVARFPEYFLFRTNTFFLIVAQGLSSIFSTFFLVLEYFYCSEFFWDSVLLNLAHLLGLLTSFVELEASSCRSRPRRPSPPDFY